MSQTTSLETLKQYAQGEVVELPPFINEEPFVVKLRRPSFLNLAKSGKIPNTLLSAANELFNKGVISTQKNGIDAEALKEMSEILDIIVEASLLEPTYKQLNDIGLELTDAQKMEIFNYSQAGIKALSSFHANRQVSNTSGVIEKIS